MVNTETQEMYIVTIDRLSKKNQKVRSIDIANERGFSKSTVHAGLKNLEDKGLVNFNAGDITLTEQGKEIVENINKKHDLIYKMLVILGMNPEIAESNACEMEHTISDEAFKVFDMHLKFAEKLPNADRFVKEFQDKEKEEK